ncbi:MAG: hypothetical protein KC729_01405 [Candidatus Eisenbacteria bacterium]|uniref:Right handed beta helix domain-containing protein n=1 Tax=Eiseniibacteriota bacterium TaxID=2212470 RepID=A0A956LVG1_UNCEI|nr:hypothetical protein [Candidatus Eisenbacteria bacterium]
MFRISIRALGWTIVAAWIATGAHATTFVVDPAGGGDFERIQDAIDASHHGDVIEVLPGTYFESLFYGGRRIVVRGVEGPEVTILDGEDSHNLATFLFGEPRASVLEGFTLRHGRGRPITAAAPVSVDLTSHPLSAADPRLRSLEQGEERGGTYGGAIVCSSAGPTLRNLIFEDNLANNGGGLAILFAAPLVDGCQFRGNVAGAGGGIFGRSDRTDFRDCVFEDNFTVFGGGFYGEDSQATGQGSSFNGNITAGGGSCYLLGTGNPGLATFHHCQFGANFSADVNGITALFHDLVVRQSVFWARGPELHVTASIVTTGGSLTVANCIFEGRNEDGVLACGSTNADIRCNVFYPGDVPQTCSPAASNRAVDPRFCDPSSGDFHVAEGSPCLPENAPAGCGAIGIYPEAGCVAPRADGSSSPDAGVRTLRERALTR